MTGEFALIQRLARQLSPASGPLLIGHGDDAAVLDLGGRAAVLAIDALVEGRHWLPALSDPEDVGWKAVAVNASDLAAMAADPIAAVVALQRPERVPGEELERLYQGMAEAADAYELKLAGGDTVASDVLSVSVAILGAIDPARVVRRSGARPGDAIVCVGGLGGAAAGLAQALAVDPPSSDEVAPSLLAAHRRPRALLAAGKALADAGARAMIDVSDGLGADLGHLCRASGVSAVVRLSDLPLADGVADAAQHLGADLAELACGGEDYALLAALPPEAAEKAARAAGRADGVAAAVVGGFSAPSEPVVAMDTPGGRVDVSTAGYDHYSQGGR